MAELLISLKGASGSITTPLSQEKQEILVVNNETERMKEKSRSAEFVWEGEIFSAVSDISFILTTSPQPPGSERAICMEVSTSVDASVLKDRSKVAFCLNKLSLHSLRPTRPGSFTKHSSSSTSSMSSLGTLEASEGEMRVIQEPEIQEEGESSAAQKKTEESAEDCAILENLQASCHVTSVAPSEPGMMEAWNGGWEGAVEVNGADIALTTEEIKFLMTVAVPFSELSEVCAFEEQSDNAFNGNKHLEPTASLTELPHGTLIAIRDSNVRRFLAVEESSAPSGTFQMVTVDHYSLCQDRAIFKVHYPNAKKNPDWFCLLSLPAKDEKGNHFRLRSQPGAGLVDVEGTGEGSCELWSLKCIEETDEVTDSSSADESLNSYSCQRGQRHSLVNKHGRQQLAFVDGFPAIGKKLEEHPLKILILATPKPLESQLSGSQDALDSGAANEAALESKARGAVKVPCVRFRMQQVAFTVLYEASGGMHMLPLVQMQLVDTVGTIQAGPEKFRCFLSFCPLLDFYEGTGSKWDKFVKKCTVNVFLRVRSKKEKQSNGASPLKVTKPPTAVEMNIEKVEILVGEAAMDAVIFLVGALDLAGPYNVTKSPVVANRCEVHNKTGLELFCHFSRVEKREQGTISPHKSATFLIRHKISRRDTVPAVTTSKAQIRLKNSVGTSTASMTLSLSHPGAMAVRTRLVGSAGPLRGTYTAPGALVVLDVSPHSAEGMNLTISSLLIIKNESGFALQLRFRRPSLRGKESSEGTNEESGAILELLDGEVMDDAEVAAESMDATGEKRRIIGGLAVGHYLLSIRPKPVVNPALGKTRDVGWSPDVEGAKPVRVAGWMEEFQRKLQKSVGRDKSSSFGSVVCKLGGGMTREGEFEGEKFENPPTAGLSNTDTSEKDVKSVIESDNEYASKETGNRINAVDSPSDIYFLVRTSRREVPISGTDKEGHILSPGHPSGPNSQRSDDKKQGNAWIAQREMVFFPTMRIRNFLPTELFVAFGDSSRDITPSRTSSEWQDRISSGKRCLLLPGRGSSTASHFDPSHSCLLLFYPVIDRVSKVVNIDENHDAIPSSKDSRRKDIVVSFGDSQMALTIRVARGDDGVALLSIYPKYCIINSSRDSIFLSRGVVQTENWRRRLGKSSKKGSLSWPKEDDNAEIVKLRHGDSIPWIHSSEVVLVKKVQSEACTVSQIDLRSMSSSTEFSLTETLLEGVERHLNYGIQMRLPESENPMKSVDITPRYLLKNDTNDTLQVSQEEFQDAPETWLSVKPGQTIPLHRLMKTSDKDKTWEPGSEFIVFLRHFKASQGSESVWDWSSPLCITSLGTFSLKSNISKATSDGEAQGSVSGKAKKNGGKKLCFFQADVVEERPSLVARIKVLPSYAVPYRIQNGLTEASISVCQKDVDSWQVLGPGSSTGFVWDDMSQPHKLVVGVDGPQKSQNEINPDKMRSWRQFRPKRSRLFQLDIPFQFQEEANGTQSPSASLPRPRRLGYEVYADGPCRVVNICEEGQQLGSNGGFSGAAGEPSMVVEFRVALVSITLLESHEKEGDSESALESTTPIAYLRASHSLLQIDTTSTSTCLELKMQRVDVDAKWKNAPFVVILRPLGRDEHRGHNFVHVAFVLNRKSLDVRHVRYASLLLQAAELNIDEETLMKLVPFIRTRKSPYVSSAASPPIYFESFEVHPIKIVASFQPSSPTGDYSSAQETLRALLHSVIQVPAVRNASMELNGVLLSHALLSYTQLALKCAQHYSWYAMRAIYLARGSELLPPGFTSLFDDSASSSIDVFFDPSDGSINLQGIAKGMFNLVRKGLRKRGKRHGTSRYLGEIKHKVKQAGSNVLYAVITEVSDNMLKGVETSGMDGLFNGLRRGILKIAMKPTILRSAIFTGGATKRFRLQRSVGTNEAYVEGYLQAMLDALFRQDYLRVKISNDEVVLKNLPPNSSLIEEIVRSVNQFLAEEGLISGNSSVSGSHSLRRLRGETENQLVPAIKALVEQLAVLIAVRTLRKQVVKLVPAIRSSKPQTNDERGTREDVESSSAKRPFGMQSPVIHLVISSAVAYLDGRLCRNIPNPFARRVVSGFLLSFVEV